MERELQYLPIPLRSVRQGSATTLFIPWLYHPRPFIVFPSQHAPNYLLALTSRVISYLNPYLRGIVSAPKHFSFLSHPSTSSYHYNQNLYSIATLSQTNGFYYQWSTQYSLVQHLGIYVWAHTWDYITRSTSS